ncbi:MAG TPA: hypothetical protein PLB02_05710 [Thermoanaerobaculia bacterium]|nr:hypothetical protein [Thermoanaerobaculia bacterium]
MTKDEEPWVLAKAGANEADGAFVAGFLEAHGVPARVVDEGFNLTPIPNERWEFAVVVPESRLSEAQEALSRREAEFPAAEGDADAVLTDDGPAHVDPDAPDGGPGPDR